MVLHFADHNWTDFRRCVRAAESGTAQTNEIHTFTRPDRAVAVAVIRAELPARLVRSTVGQNDYTAQILTKLEGKPVVIHRPVRARHQRWSGRDLILLKRSRVIAEPPTGDVDARRTSVEQLDVRHSFVDYDA